MIPESVTDLLKVRDRMWIASVSVYKALREMRTQTLQEAAKAVCGYCKGLEGHDPVPTFAPDGYYWHLILKANGWNRCSAGAIWKLLEDK